jgi:polyphosphate kinase 2 (PPK2 family)
MLEKIDLSKKIEKKEFKKLMPRLRNQLYAMQKASWDAKIPIVILFEGWDAAGKGTSIQKLTERLDPRGFKLYPIRAARTYEKKRPWLWRFWLKIPGHGEWAIFDRSWYGRVLVERMENLIPESEWRRGYRDIVDFERTLADDGYLIIKFFLHISREEQRRRFEKLSQDPLNAWHVAPEDWEHHRQYDDWTLAYEEMFERTDTEWGPWTIVEATNRRHTWVKIFQTIIASLEDRLTALNAMPDSSIWEVVRSEDEDIEEEMEAEEEAMGEVLIAQEPLAESPSDDEKPSRRRKPSRTRKPKEAIEVELQAEEELEVEAMAEESDGRGEGEKGADDVRNR